MLRGVLARVLTAAAVLVIGVVGSAVASPSALAAQYNLTRSAGGAAVPLGTAFTMTSEAFEFTNSTGSSVFYICRASALTGASDEIVGGGPSAGLSVTGGSFSRCTAGGTPLSITGNFATPWQITPVSGTASPFGVTISNVRLTLTCGSGQASYTGTLTGGTENNSTSGSYISLPPAGTLTKSGTGCAAVPSTVYVDGTYTLATVGGSPVSSSNNLWLNYS